MKIDYTGRHTEVTSQLRSSSEAGVERIRKILGDTLSVHIIFTEDKYRKIAEITIVTRDQSFVATCESTDMPQALHDALAKIEQQAVRHNQKLTTNRRHPKSDLKSSIPDDASLAPAELGPAEG